MGRWVKGNAYNNDDIYVHELPTVQTLSIPRIYIQHT